MHFKDFKCIFHYQRTTALVILFQHINKDGNKLLQRKKYLVPGCALYEKRKKKHILEKYVKTTNFTQNWIVRYNKEHKYIKLIVAIV